MSAGFRRQQTTDLSQQGVTGVVAMPIVDLFQPVDVTQHETDRERLLGEQLLEPFVHSSAVREACEGIAIDQGSQLAAFLDPGESRAGDPAQRFDGCKIG